jgi:hypothetical protein
MTIHVIIEDLRAKGYDIGKSYLQPGVGETTGGVLHYVINGVALSWQSVVALSAGRLTVPQVADQTSSRTDSPTPMPSVAARS